MQHEDIARQIPQLTAGFTACSKMLSAIGDETRQHLILEMLRLGNCNGVRVGAITEKTNLSRPAVSHHLHVLKDAGLVRVRKEGTMNFYYFAPDRAVLSQLVATLQLALDITGAMPDRSCDSF